MDHHYCYLCNQSTGNTWVCRPCVTILDAIGLWDPRCDFLMPYPIRISSEDPVPVEVTVHFGCICGPPCTDPDLTLPEGI